MSGVSKRVLVIGLDGATLDLVGPWAAAGYLPNIARLIDAGVSGPLRSTLQPLSAPAWATFLTGVNQGQHSLFDFVRRREGAYDVEVTNASHVAAPNVFQIASRGGLSVISVNVPYTSPPRPVSGIVVGGPFAPALTPEQVYPSSYFDVVKQLVPGYFILPDYEPNARDPLGTYDRHLHEEIEQRERLSLHLMRTEKWDLFQVVFMSIDEVQHTFWRFQDVPDSDSGAVHRDTIRRLYQRADAAIGALISQAAADGSGRETVVVIMSDHGGGPLRWTINLNRWLSDNGSLRFQRKRAGTAASLLQVAARAYRRYVPPRLRASIRTRLGARHFGRVKSSLESAAMTSSIDWTQTQAYSLGSGGNIYINLAGREPEGIVQPGPDYEQICEAIRAGLMGLLDPETGEPVVERVHRREELYHGAHLRMAPDLVVQWRDYACWGRSIFGATGEVFEAQRHFDFSDQPVSGAHKLDGLLIAQGAGIRSQGQIAGARLVDMAPTILGLLGVAIPRYMDGKFLTALLTDPGQSLPIEEDSSELAPGPDDAIRYSADEESKIKQHLKNLGYLE